MAYLSLAHSKRPHRDISPEKRLILFKKKKKAPNVLEKKIVWKTKKINLKTIYIVLMGHGSHFPFRRVSYLSVVLRVPVIIKNRSSGFHHKQHSKGMTETGWERNKMKFIYKLRLLLLLMFQFVGSLISGFTLGG